MSLEAKPVAEPQQNRGLGVGCALLAWFSFTLTDVGIKYLSEDYALHQIVLFRSSIALCVTLMVFVPQEGGWSFLKTQHLKIHLARGLCVVFANLTFFAGLASMNLPEATSIFFVAPLLITALSVFFLGERVGIHRWMAVAAGMLGVIVMLRPGTDAFKFAALLPLLAAFAYAVLQILTRKIGFKDKASTMSAYMQITFVVVCLLFGALFADGRYGNTGNPSIDFLFRAWRWPVTRDLLMLVGLGVLSALGAYMVSQAYRLCEAVVIAPFEYVALLLAIFWSIIIFNVWPDTVAWIGISLILSSGLYVFWREVLLGRKPAVKHRMPRHR